MKGNDSNQAEAGFRVEVGEKGHLATGAQGNRQGQEQGVIFLQGQLA